jgi:integrase/recombinase XerD
MTARPYRARGPAARTSSVTVLRTVQLLLGHVKLEHTVIYLHLSQRHLQAVANPLDAMPVSGTDTVRRTRRLHRR